MPTSRPKSKHVFLGTMCMMASVSGRAVEGARVLDMFATLVVLRKWRWTRESVQRACLVEARASSWTPRLDQYAASSRRDRTNVDLAAVLGPATVALSRSFIMMIRRKTLERLLYTVSAWFNSNVAQCSCRRARRWRVSHYTSIKAMSYVSGAKEDGHGLQPHIDCERPVLVTSNMPGHRSTNANYSIARHWTQVLM